MKNLQSSNPLGKLALIALSTFPSLGGCSLGEWQGNSAEARPTADVKADSL
jgi:hypothetical protein